MSNRNLNGSVNESLPVLERVEGQESQAEAGGENNNSNNSNDRSRNNRRRNSANDRRRNNSNYRSRNNTSDDTPPGLERVESQESGAEAEGENSNWEENIPNHEEDFPDNDGEAESFLQPMWSTPELLDHTAETSGLPMEGVVLAWRGNNTGKSVIVGYACGGSVTARLIPAARRPIPSRAPNISEKSLGRRKDDIRTERDIKAWGIVAWRVDKKSVSQDPISLLKPMTGAWYPETYVYIHWWSGDASWESRHNLRYVCASNHLKTDMLIYNVAKEQEANYREALTGVRPEYAPANTRMTNDHWRNVNAYRGAHWFQPRAEENRRITSIRYEPVINEEDNSQEFDSDIGMGEGSIVSSDAFRQEDEEGYYEGSNEGEEREHFEGEEAVQDDGEQQYGHMPRRQRYLSPIDEEDSVPEGRVFFTPEGTPTRARGHGESQRRYGIFTPRATRSPSSGHLFQGNRGQARRTPETPGNQRMPRFNQGNSGRSNHSNWGNEQRIPQSSQGSQPQGDPRRQTPHSSRSNRSNQDNQWQTPHSSRSNRSNPEHQRQRIPQSSQGSQPQGDQRRQTPHSSRSNRSNQEHQSQRTPQSSQGSQPQGDQPQRTPHSSRSNRSNQGDQPQPTPRSSRSNRSNQGDQPQRTPHSSRSSRSNQEHQRQRTPQSSQGSQSQGDQRRQTPHSSRSNRSNQGDQPQPTPHSSRSNRSNQSDQPQRTPHSSRSSRSNQEHQRQRTPQSSQGSQSQGDQRRQTPHSSRSNRSNQEHQSQRTPQSSQGNRPNQSSISLSEGNQSQPQQRRGRGRPRRGNLSNPPSNIPTRRSTRHTRAPGGP
ncbi:hypothetical protein PENARI_c003G10421 [Penicillium arizonense]|uniref:Uncharacterized protein n=1 Tax=Penicillium arizonense TaxID=1835702 RepID=A0A1F5LTW4_PENAI|nr:hypothetical protein PENARI_c003G10421 [Penicillium arizonense]OGE56644.1 hypothetical protein PENARI_c003G10421 [Penicillium arizonense]